MYANNRKGESFTDVVMMLCWILAVVALAFTVPDVVNYSWESSTTALIVDAFVPALSVLMAMVMWVWVAKA